MKKTLILLTLFCTLVATPAFAKKKPKIAVLPPPLKLNLIWQADVPGVQADLKQTPVLEGVTVVSPCWFDVITARGLVRNKMKQEDKDYVDTMHQRGYKVWPLVTNSFNPGLTHMLINDKEGQENLRENLLKLAQEYKFDGYNLDFENIADQDRDGLTNLVKDLAASLRAKNLTVSMDVTIPTDTPFWSRCYDRGALAQQVDYLMLMAYDQYSPAMKYAGSTAGLNWVNQGIKNTLKEVPPHKLVLGLPFYARLWESKKGYTRAQGKTIDMAAMNKLIIDKNITPVWNKDLGQNYLTYEENGKLYQVWQENAVSLVEKVKLVHTYNLAGIASWRKGFETPDVWPALKNELNKTDIKIEPLP